MTPTAQELNDWLTANGQSAIKTLAQQGMTLRFVEGPENYHQDRPSLAVGAEGVGFTFQMNHQWHSDPRHLVEQAMDRAPEFQRAFAAAREQYGDKALPLSKRDWVEPLLVRGECWDICNHQTTTTKKEAANQKHHWLTILHSKGDQDVAQLVGELCERQALYDRVRTPEGLLALVREPGAMRYVEDNDAYTLNNPHVQLMLSVETTDQGTLFNTSALALDPKYGRYFPLCDKTTARLSSDGIGYTTDGFDLLTPAITAKDLDMDPAVLDTFVSMDMKPVDILTFDVQKAQASASADFLDSLDMDMFSQENDQDMTR